MDKAPAGAGVNDTGEFLALDVPYDKLIEVNRDQVREIARLQATLISTIESMHGAAHGTRRVFSTGPQYIPPKTTWEQCRHITCRNVRAALLGDVAEEEGKGED